MADISFCSYSVPANIIIVSYLALGCIVHNIILWPYNNIMAIIKFSVARLLTVINQALATGLD